MKTIKMMGMVLFFGLFLMLGTNAFAQDPIMVAPKNSKILLENNVVRVYRFEFAPGEVIPWHSHPNHVVYPLSDGKIEITEKDKAPAVFDIKMGNPMYMPAVTHMGKNIGTTTIIMIITEIKPTATPK